MENKFYKGQKVWCKARVTWFLPYVHVMCGTIKYKLPLIVKLFIKPLVLDENKGDFYCVKMNDGSTIFHPEESITDINKAIRMAENHWGVDKKCTDPVQFESHLKLKFWYQEMIEYQKYESC